MKTQSKAEEYRRINLIANGRIPVAEESPIFNLFSARREVARRLKDDEYSEEQRQYVLETFEDIESKIKEYLLL
jgi:hypothetical protein